MRIKLASEDTTIHVAAVQNVHTFDHKSENHVAICLVDLDGGEVTLTMTADHVAICLVDLDGGEVTLMMTADLARTIYDGLAKCLPSVKYEPTDEGEADAPEVDHE